MRITHNILIANFLRNLNSISNRIENSQLQLTTGLKYNRPHEGPIEIGQSVGYQSTISKISQYLKNVDDGNSQVGYVDTILQSVIGDLGRARDLVLDGANDNLNQADRVSIAQEIDLILQTTLANANSRFRDRYTFAGWQTKTTPFEERWTQNSEWIEDIVYFGNLGIIDRLVGDSDQLTVNVSGKDVFLEQTYTREGKILPVAQPLGFHGRLTLNDVDFEITPEMTLTDIQVMLNAASSETYVFASLDNGRIILESATAVSEFILTDNRDNELIDDLGLYVSGAFNLGFTSPVLPLTDSTPAIFTGAGPVANLTYDNTNNVMNIFLGADANGGTSKAANIYITPNTYASVADLINEIQNQFDLEFGDNKLIVSDAGGGVLQIETVATGTNVNAGDLVIGGPFNGVPDSASDSADLNLIAFVGNAPATPAGIAGVDGNDKFIIDLGPTTSNTGLDVPPQIIDLDASVIVTVDDLINEINNEIFDNNILRGAVIVRLHQGRLMFESTKTGLDVLSTDFQFTEGATGTLAALGISDTPFPVQIVGTPPGFPFLVVAGFNDTVIIDIGPTVSNDGTNPAAQTLVFSPGVYNTIFEVQAELNDLITANSELNGAVNVQVYGTPGNEYLVLESAKIGPGIRGDDLYLDGSLIGTLGWVAGYASDSGGSGDGHGFEIESRNIFKTLITMRNDLLGTVGLETKFLNIQNSDRELIGILDGDLVTIEYDAGTWQFNVLATDTLENFIRYIQLALGTRATVKLTSDGRILIKNLETNEIQNMSITVESATGEPRTLMNDILDDIPVILPGLVESTTAQMFDPVKYLRLGDEDLVLADNDLENLLKYEAIVGARANRLNTVYNLFTAEDLNIRELKNAIDAANYAEVLTALSQQELVLQSSLAVGGRVLTPSLLDYLI